MLAESLTADQASTIVAIAEEPGTLQQWVRGLHGLGLLPSSETRDGERAVIVVPGWLARYCV